MEHPKTLDLVEELVLRLLSPVDSPSSYAIDELPRALRFAHRLLSSRMAPSLAPDELLLAETIKRQLAACGRSSDALAFSDLRTKLSARSSAPGSIRNRWALLYLLKSLSDARRREPLLPSSTTTGLPALPLNPQPSHQSPLAAKKTLPPSCGILLVSKDPDNIREIALREYGDIVVDETEVSESALVRDILFVSQGIDGRYVRFDKVSDRYEPPDLLKLPRSMRTMVCKLSELGWLFRKVRGYITESMSCFPAEEVGTVGQAFCSALQDELSDYYKLLAVLESHSLNPIPTPGSVSGVTVNYLSLRRLAVWLAEPMVRMRLMAVLVDGCRSLRGGAMAGAIHERAQHGDPLVQEFMGCLLRRVCSPLFEMVRSWVLEGELEDTFVEFFIQGQAVKAESLWREGYQIQSAMLPSFISPALAQRILRTGKSINFLRACCEDNGWAAAAAEAAAHVGTTTTRGGLVYGETNALEALVVEAAKRIDRHLMDVIHKRYRFKDHCLAIKRYLLLGQGDFVQYLMDIIGPELSEPANTISSFHLSGLLEMAIRASNAQYDDWDILDHLKVKMMENGDGNRGWDVFSLEYDATAPLDTIFTASVMKKYLKIFNFLWKLKRVEHALIGTWKMMKPNSIISCIYTKEGAAVKAKFVAVLRRGTSKLKTKLKEPGSYPDVGRKAIMQLAGEFLQRMGEDLDKIAKEYSASLDAFISQLPMQQHVDLKFLLFRLDFTEFYSRLSPSK
ncbi:hypothetical protein BHE74_00008691 [Ensete ventricosum]|nr:hypothetical protein BHE74_00008691 [Ensete ventricosum]RZR87143.1 hypothetical protein BHM03_00014489 [Ensete ventricosum]